MTSSKADGRMFTEPIGPLLASAASADRFTFPEKSRVLGRFRDPLQQPVQERSSYRLRTLVAVSVFVVQMGEDGQHISVANLFDRASRHETGYAKLSLRVDRHLAPRLLGLLSSLFEALSPDSSVECRQQKSHVPSARPAPLPRSFRSSTGSVPTANLLSQFSGARSPRLASEEHPLTLEAICRRYAILHTRRIHESCCRVGQCLGKDPWTRQRIWRPRRRESLPLSPELGLARLGFLTHHLAHKISFSPLQSCKLCNLDFG